MAVISQINNATTPTSLVLKGGQIYNSTKNKFEKMDLKIQNGKIVTKEKNIKTNWTDTVRMLKSNHYISPGWIDLHTHYFGCWGKGMNPVEHGLNKGVTLQVDAGSAGMSTFEDFDQQVLNKTNGTVISMLNIAPCGLAQRTGENMFLTNHNAEETARVALENPDKIKMIKLRIGKTQNTPETGIKALKMAKESAKKAGDLPVMVHIEDGSPLEEIFSILDAGDIVTHAFRKDGTCNILDGNKLKPFVISALKRGVRLDVGHGGGGFHKENAQTAIASLELLGSENYIPFTTSTDLHCFSLNGPVYDLRTTVAKMISIGMSREDAVASITKYPAESLKLPASRWKMDIDDPANLTIWEHNISDEEVYEFHDPHKTVWHGKEMLNPKMVYVNGQLIDIAG